ncbi:DNA polymerase I [Microcoleus sp. FACHB-831]|uniref:DNA polymerase I n=1 Tax=Microcoleus sp. FACHB-831 TaxID=2692827 RepID=UPI0016877231|nr:DNA polymerase I [Microcoleus sp. FACHB-831]MBD1921146.1 DNA polymerase I [Microcoleus sp. FACHB-831]
MSQSNSVSPETLPLFILVDGHSLAYRSYFAFAKGRDGGLKTKTGIPTSVCFGFIKSLLEVMASQQPQAIAIAFDLGLPTFRHEADDTYKADRAETPEDFIEDLKNLHELLDAFNVPIVTAPGFEADDVLGTLAQRFSAAGYRVKIVTGDRDLFQLVDTAKGISVLYLGQNFWQRSSSAGPVEFGPEQVKAKLGIEPAQVVDYKALCGDASDNIPGVKGIGDKTAVKLLTDYGSLEGIYASLDKIQGAVKKKLETGKEDAYKSQHLAQIVVDVPLEISLEDCQLKGFDSEPLVPLLEKLEFRSYVAKVKQLQQAFGGKVEEENSAADGVSSATSASQVEDSQPAIDDDYDNDLWFFSAADTAAAGKKEPSLINPRIIDTPEKLTELVKLLQTFTNPATPVAWDTETSDLEPRDSDLVGIGCCWGTEKDAIAYIPLAHKTGNNLDKTAALEALRPILENTEYPKSLQNAKFDRLVLRCQGIKLAGVVFDTMLASYVLNPEGTHNLTELSQRYLEGVRAKSYKELGLAKGKNISDLDIPTVAEYCGMDVYTTFALVPKLREELDKIPVLHKLLLEVEQPVEPVLAQMEYFGIRVDAAYLKELSQQLEKDLASLEEKAYEVAGEKFNLGSPKKLSQLLFDTLKLDTKKSRKIATGYSTDAATLEKLQGDHPVVDAILEYRTLSKLKSTYVDALPLLIREDTGRVHTDFNQTVTATGRLSSSNPNLQNIPIRTAFSQRIRGAFLPQQDWLLVAADYSQVELRILAHLSQEPVLVEAYRNNQDIHTVTARLIFDKEDITSEERRLAKTINFGVIYGMGALRFARSTGVDKNNASEFIKRFNDRYPKVFEYLQRVKKEAIAHGYVETILGRRRYFKFEGSSLNKRRNPDEVNLSELKRISGNDAQLLRAAANAPIQGSSADIIKIAMVKLHEILQNYQTRLLLQVHDELVFEVPPSEWEELQPKIKSAMENAVSLSVPLVVDIHSGQNWMETK